MILLPHYLLSKTRRLSRGENSRERRRQAPDVTFIKLVSVGDAQHRINEMILIRTTYLSVFQHLARNPVIYSIKPHVSRMFVIIFNLCDIVKKYIGSKLRRRLVILPSVICGANSMLPHSTRNTPQPLIQNSAPFRDYFLRPPPNQCKFR